MSKRRKPPRWLSRLVIDAIQSDQMREHGGLPGLRDDTALESALARPPQRWHYELETDAAALAAVYAFGLVKDHPYRDGNRRIGFLALVTLLGINGFEFDAPEEEVVVAMVKLADGTLSEEQLADWVRSHVTS